MSRLLVRAAVKVMPGSTAISKVSDPTVTSAVLRAWGQADLDLLPADHD
jgi:hypothetical protein